MYYLGYDIGSSSIKVALVDASTNQAVGVESHPTSEMDILSLQLGWAEQDPNIWWSHMVTATHKILQKQPRQVVSQIAGIGVTYQMHGLVLLDKQGELIRDAIIWCDSRAVDTGDQITEKLGASFAFEHLLNLPGNFTLSKLKWVKDNEPELFEKIDKVLLPGDYINYRLTGELNTTSSALSEAMLWDFINHRPACDVMSSLGMETDLLPPVVDIFSEQGTVQSVAAEQLGIPKSIPVRYRAGDQPNNAMSLGVLQPGEIAATGGTSGVVYGVVDQWVRDASSRVNTFAHVNHTCEEKRLGVLLCINGAGSQYRWLRQSLTSNGADYNQMEEMLSEVPINSEGVRVIPFGNGAERMLNNRNVGSHILNLHFNRHSKGHIYRASIEGIAYSFIYGISILQELGLDIKTIKVGNDNLFQSSVFANTVASVLQTNIEILENTGAVGAARAVGYALGDKESLCCAMEGDQLVKEVTPSSMSGKMSEGYHLWKDDLTNLIRNEK